MQPAAHPARSVADAPVHRTRLSIHFIGPMSTSHARSQGALSRSAQPHAARMNQSLPSYGPDRLRRFLLPHAGVRGVHVRLDDAWREIHAGAGYPPVVAELLGEACAAAALFTGHAKVDGRLSI